MEIFDCQITCKHCKKILLLKTEDISYIMGNTYRNILGFESNTPTRIFQTKCGFCSGFNKINRALLSQDCLEKVKEAL